MYFFLYREKRGAELCQIFITPINTVVIEYHDNRSHLITNTTRCVPSCVTYPSGVSVTRGRAEYNACIFIILFTSVTMKSR